MKRIIFLFEYFIVVIIIILVMVISIVSSAIEDDIKAKKGGPIWVICKDGDQLGNSFGILLDVIPLSLLLLDLNRGGPSQAV